MAVVMCVDRSFVLPLAVALTSLDHSSRGDHVTAHVIHSGISPETRVRVSSGLSSTQVNWHAVDDKAVKGAHHSVFLSPASLYRLLLGDLLPHDVRRVVYLDADTVTVQPLRQLFDVDLGSSVLGAVRDAASPWAAGPLGPPWKVLGMSPDSPYFNSGVLAIDLARWRDEQIGLRCLQVLRAAQPRWGDQDALNVALEGKWSEVTRRWNLQTSDALGQGIAWALWRRDVESALEDPAVIHYTDRDKPWNHGSQHPLASHWYEALDRTTWSGWRPAPLPRHPLAESVVRGLRTLRDMRRHRAARLPS
jgi:lipopolysaccharide biosynthesis glycosyltransferase